MAVLVTRSFDKAHGGHVAAVDCIPEIGQVVLVIGLVGLADHSDRAGRHMVDVGRRHVVLEGLMVGNVVPLGVSITAGVSRAADSSTVGFVGSGSESALEPAPANA